MAMIMEGNKTGSPASTDPSVTVQMTEILMSTVSGINTLRSALGDNVVRELLALLLKDMPPKSSRGDNSYLPVGLLDN
jgi:hypothetical protein